MEIPNTQSTDSTSNIPDEVFIYNIFGFLDPFSMGRYIVAVCYRWHILGQKSLKKRKMKVFEPPYKLPTFSLLLRLVELEVFDFKMCGRTIVELCKKNIRTHWVILDYLNENIDMIGSSKYRINWSHYEKNAMYDSIPIPDRMGWVAAVYAPLSQKFKVVLRFGRSIADIIKFAEIVEGYVDEIELGIEVKKCVNYLVKYGTMKGLLEVYDSPHLLTKLPALFTNEMFYESLKYTSAEHGSVSKKATNFCLRILEEHSNLPNFDVTENDWEIFHEIICESKSIPVIQKLFSDVSVISTEENIEVISDSCLGKIGSPNEWMISFLIDMTVPSSTLPRGLGNSFNLEDLRRIPNNQMILLISGDFSTPTLEKMMSNIDIYPNIIPERNGWNLFFKSIDRSNSKLLELILKYTEIKKEIKVIYEGIKRSIKNKKRRLSSSSTTSSPPLRINPITHLFLTNEDLVEFVSENQKQMVLDWATQDELGGLVEEIKARWFS